MKCILMTNGYYGDLTYYEKLVKGNDCIICADGGANYAYKMGLVPQYIVGDLDSIEPEIRDHYIARGVGVKKYPRSKDFTDTQLALSLAQEIGVDDIIILGSLGGRLDHTLSNLYAGLEQVEQGTKITHYSPDCVIYLLKGKMTLQGEKGDLVSVLALSDQAAGVNESGFDYPLNNVILEKKNPYAVSNRMSSNTAEISVKNGALLVFHYPGQ